MDFKSYLRDVLDFPKPGILFKDITPLINEPQVFARAIDELAERVAKFKPQKICAIESRGFVFGAPLALILGVGFVPVRKPGKLPWRVYSQKYNLEYGQDGLEMHQDALKSGESVLIVDDVLATGGTAWACQQLVRAAGASVVGFAFLLEITALNGRQKLDNLPRVCLMEV